MNIKSYLPIKDKLMLVEMVLMNSMDEDTKKINFALKQMWMELLIVKFYTNIELEDGNVFEIYDKLKQDDTVATVFESLSAYEYKFIEESINRQIKQEQEYAHSIGVVVKESLDKLLAKIPDEKAMNKLIKLLPKELNKVNPESLKMLGEALKFNNPQ